jgi:hypothetical protein
VQADLDQQEAVIKQREVAAAKGAPGAAEVAKAFTTVLKERRKAIEADRKSREEMFDQIIQDLGSLTGSRR